MDTILFRRIHKNKKDVSVGRGGKRGKTSGRGTKGQKARSGHKIRPEIRDMIKRIPKLRGHGKNSNHMIGDKPMAVSLTAINAAFEAGSDVTPMILAEKGLIRSRESSSARVKILGGEITKKINFWNVLVSASAKAAIEKAGGKVENKVVVSVNPAVKVATKPAAPVAKPEVKKDAPKTEKKEKKPVKVESKKPAPKKEDKK